MPASIVERAGFLHRLLRPPEAALKLADLLTTGPELHPYLPLLPRAVELSSQYRVGVYDCLYVARADIETCGLVTADQRLVRTLQGDFPFIIELAAIP